MSPFQIAVEVASQLTKIVEIVIENVITDLLKQPRSKVSMQKKLKHGMFHVWHEGSSFLLEGIVWNSHKNIETAAIIIVG